MKQSESFVREEGEICRICLDGQTDSSNLISAFQCTGSVKYVHEECMKTWVLSSNANLSEVKCEICHTKLRLDYAVASHCVCGKDMQYTALSVSLIVVIFLLVSVCVMMLVYFSSSLGTQKMVDLLVVCICSLGILMLSILLGFSIYKSCIVLKVTKLKILEQELTTEKSCEVSAIDSDGHLVTSHGELRARNRVIARSSLDLRNLETNLYNRHGRSSLAVLSFDAGRTDRTSDI